MIAIIIGYLIIQIASSIFLFCQYAHQSTFITHLIVTILATASYLAAHFRSPGYANSEMLKLASPNSQVDLSSSVEPTSTKINAGQASQVERGFCRNCKEDQLLRMKHCYDCGKCVATFDHHCLWLDNCIGQKNRPLFYACLWVNFIEIINGVVALVWEMFQAGEWFPYQIAFLSFLGILGFGVGALTFLHTYLMLKNLTTWESLRWRNIHYLIDLDPRKGSPFCKGILGNIADYWKSGFEYKYREWKFNAGALEQLKTKTQTKPVDETEQVV